MHEQNEHGNKTTMTVCQAGSVLPVVKINVLATTTDEFKIKLNPITI